MSDYDHFGSSEEESAEIKKLQADVVRELRHQQCRT